MSAITGIFNTKADVLRHQIAAVVGHKEEARASNNRRRFKKLGRLERKLMSKLAVLDD